MTVKDRMVVLPDVHAPNHNRPAIRAILQFISDFKPTILIQLGDFCDWDSFTSYDPRRKEDIVNVETEVKSAKSLLRKIENSLPAGCKKVMIGGNHEARVPKYLASFGMSLTHQRLAKDIKSWEEAYELEEHGWEWVQYGEVYQFGKVLFTHGWQAGGQNHAAAHLRMFHKSLLYGHTHTFQVATGNGRDGKPIIAASIGTLSNFKLSYLVGKPPVNWINMFATIEFMPDGTFTPSFIPIINGRFVKNGVTYGI